MDQTALLWGGFVVFIVAMLALDIAVFHRRPHVVGMREALTWTGIWIALALLFNAGVWFWFGPNAALEFFTGYLVEKSLSIDNVFVFVLLFGYFDTPAAYHHKVLFLGILGAIVARTVFIVGGLTLLASFHWTIYVFGAFLVATGVSMVWKKQDYAPDRNPVIRLARRWLPVSDRYENGHLLVSRNGRWFATPLLIVLLAVESTDILFAVDSIPAIFAITRDPFIVFSSNIFALLGLRALYFAVAGFLKSFHYLHYGFASIIAMLGVKMLLSDVFKVPIAASLGLIVVILAVAVIASLLRPRYEDLKRILERSERRGLFSFRRLLVFEKVFDLGSEPVSRVMCARPDVQVLRLDAGWEENRQTIVRSQFSRFPLVSGIGEQPHGFIHVKDLLYRESPPWNSEEWLRLARPYCRVRENTTLEALLVDLQRHRQQMALVFDSAGAWIGLVTLEDVIEAIVGDVGDEFGKPSPELPPLTADHVTMALSAESLESAVVEVAGSLVISNGPLHVDRGVAVVVATRSPVRRPVLTLGRSEAGIPLPGRDDRIHLLFTLLLPGEAVNVQEDFAATIAASIESDYVRERLIAASDPDEIVEVFRAGFCVAA